MQFGQTKASKVKLINGSSLHKFTIETNLVSHKSSFGGYDYNNAEAIRNSLERTNTGSQDRFAVSMGFNQPAVAPRKLGVGVYTNNAQNKEEIEEMVKLYTQAKDANSVFYSGVSYYPIGVGQVFTLQNKTVEHELIAIEVTHHSEVNGNYSCEFKAIPADVAVPYYTNPQVFALAESQPAKVIDNNDPEKMGRVKVEYYWNGRENESDWMRMIQPHGGSGKGFYFIPEIKEEVLVGFEGGNAERPYIMGTHYNGEASSGYETPNNDLKVMQTRSGNRIISDDSTGDVTIESQKGETLAIFYGDGSIKFKAPKNIEFEAGEDFIVNAGKNIIMNAGNNIEESAGDNKATVIDGNMHTSVGLNKILHVAGDYDENIEGNLKSHTEKERHETGVEGIQSNSEKDINKHSKKNLENNSGENTTHN